MLALAPDRPLRSSCRPHGRGRLAAALAALLPAAALASHEAGAAAGGAEWLGPKAPAVPRRVVALAPSVTDTVVALGLADRLVGVTRYDDAPEVKTLPRVGGFLDPSPEAVLALRPDLVLWVTDGGALPAVRRIASLGVPVRAIPVISVADVLAASRLVADALGDAPAGERLARTLEASIEAARRRAVRGPRPRVLFVVGRDPLVVAGPGSFPDELVRLCGGDNVVKGPRAWPIYPLERAVADAPDLVVDGAVLEPAEGLARLGAIAAVRNGAVHRLRDDSALRPGPRLDRALLELSAAFATWEKAKAR
jgi:cobalamin transport system substrate-binding protein